MSVRSLSASSPTRPTPRLHIPAESQFPISWAHIPKSHNDAIDERIKAVQDNKYFVALDIDECSAIGSDTNDILTVVLHAIHENHRKRTRGAEGVMSIDEEDRILKRTAIDLLNPEMIAAMRRIKSQTGAMPYIVVYTNKAGIAKPFCELLSQTLHAKDILLQSPRLPLDSKENIRQMANFQHALIEGDNGGNTLFLEGANKSSDMSYLTDLWLHYKKDIEYIEKLYYDMSLTPNIEFEHDKRERMAYNLQKVGVLTWAISEVLKLEYKVPVFISAVTFKDLRTICPTLGCDIQNIWLYDDRANIHAKKLSDQYPELEIYSPIELQMIQVPEYTFHEMLAWVRKNIEKNDLGKLIPDIKTHFRGSAKLIKEFDQISTSTRSWPKDRLLLDPKDISGFHLGGDALDASTPIRSIPWDTRMFTRQFHVLGQPLKNRRAFSD